MWTRRVDAECREGAQWVKFARGARSVGTAPYPLIASMPGAILAECFDAIGDVLSAA